MSELERETSKDTTKSKNTTLETIDETGEDTTAEFEMRRQPRKDIIETKPENTAPETIHETNKDTIESENTTLKIIQEKLKDAAKAAAPFVKGGAEVLIPGLSAAIAYHDRAIADRKISNIEKAQSVPNLGNHYAATTALGLALSGMLIASKYSGEVAKTLQLDSVVSSMSPELMVAAILVIMALMRAIAVVSHAIAVRDNLNTRADTTPSLKEDPTFQQAMQRSTGFNLFKNASATFFGGETARLAMIQHRKKAHEGEVDISCPSPQQRI